MSKIENSTKKSFKIIPTHTRLVSYGMNNTNLHIKGTTTLLVEANNRCEMIHIFIVEGNHRNLLSGHTAIELKLIELPHPQNYNNASVLNTEEKVEHMSSSIDLTDIPNRLKPLLKKYETSLFSGNIGRLKEHSKTTHKRKCTTSCTERKANSLRFTKTCSYRTRRIRKTGDNRRHNRQTNPLVKPYGNCTQRKQWYQIMLRYGKCK